MNVRAVLLSALSMPTGLALAADALFSDPSSLPKVSCDDIQYSEAFLQRYPKAPASCIEARIYNGEKWAKFKAKIYLVNLPEFVTVEMLDVAGNPVETFSLKPAPNDKIVIDSGKSMSFSDLKAGDVVTFWKSEQRLDTKAMPADTAASWLVLPPQRLSQK